MRVRALAAMLALAACGDDGSAPADATALDAAIDARPPDASTDAAARAASIVDCASVTGVGGLTAEITDGKGYVPSVSVTIRVGQVARFAYADANTEHTIVSGQPRAADGLFASPPFTDHGTFTCIRFESAGEYPIHCDRHPTGPESGVITVSR